MEEVKKIERKRKRFAARLKASKGINCTETPGKNIVICNAGQATGFDKEISRNLIESYQLNIAPPKFIAEKGECHSYLIFSNTEDAVLFFDSVKCKHINVKSNSVLYLNYVENVPNTEIICQHPGPKDLDILLEFISTEEEINFLTLFENFDNSDDNNLKNRQVKHYGYEFRYGTNDVDLSAPLDEKIPRDCDILWERLREKGYDLGIPDQLTVNKYSPGQGIPYHVDRHSPFGDTILSLSLGAPVVMDWRHHSGKQVPVEVPARSLLIMQGEARYDWQHGIQPRTYDPIIETHDSGNPYKVITSDTRPRGTRISLTFRWTRSGPCQCLYKTLCDSKIEGDKDIGDDVASNLEELHVHQVYEKIAGHFSATRFKPWPRVLEFLGGVPAGAVVVDLGCGNGKNVLARSDIVQIAGERSLGLLEECKSHVKDIPGADCVRLDLLQSCLRDSSADVVICIAVIHHFSSKARRLQAINNISRLLRPGARALITVWAKDQQKSNYLCKNKTNDKGDQVISVGGLVLPVHENRTQFEHNDLLVPWKLREKRGDKLVNTSESTLLRYYHVFEENELSELCSLAPELLVENSFYEEGNWCVICKKKIE